MMETHNVHESQAEGGRVEAVVRPQLTFATFNSKGMAQPFLIFDEVTWLKVRDGNETARGLFDRHYSRKIYADGRKPKQFVGPGFKMVLLTPEADALFVWRKFLSGDGQQGVNCAVFRNESQRLSSDLIKEASRLAWQRWPGERLYTYVNPKKVRSTNPGYCFIKAGWRRCGITKWNKLIILECLPEMIQLAAA